MQSWMTMGGFIRNSSHQAKLENQFQFQPEPKFYRNLDMSIGGHITVTQFWIRDYMDQRGGQSLEQHMSQKLNNQINSQAKRVEEANR